MKELQRKPAIQVKYGQVTIVESFALDNNLVASDVLADLKALLREHYFNFGIRPFNISYLPPSGYVVEAMPIVGVMSGRLLDVEMLPKLSGLSLGKCIGLAQHCAMQGVNFINRKPLSGMVSDRKDYTSMEYIGLSFYDSVISVIMNGLARRFCEVMIPRRKIEGTINIQETIAAGNAYLPIQEIVEPDLNIFPNRFIRTAIQRCVDKLADARLRNGFCSLISEFEGVDPYSLSELDRPIYLHDFTIPRSEYHRCLSLAEAILYGKTYEGFGSDELPSFAINLDLVFEQFCSLQIRALLSNKVFSVELQKDIPHDIFPKVRNKSIVPDAIIRNHQNRNALVLDFKNKYSRLSPEGALDISNSDLFQMAYYMNTLHIKNGVLVYPSTEDVAQYPIRKSGSEASYQARVKKFIKSGGLRKLAIFYTGEPISIYLYQIDLTGSMANTISSMATLCVLVESLLKE